MHPPPFLHPSWLLGVCLLKDSGRESILTVGRERRAEEKEGQRGHHSPLWQDGWKRGRRQRGRWGGGCNKLCYRWGSQRCRGASGVLGAVFFYVDMCFRWSEYVSYQLIWIKLYICDGDLICLHVKDKLQLVTWYLKFRASGFTVNVTFIKNKKNATLHFLWWI